MASATRRVLVAGFALGVALAIGGCRRHEAGPSAREEGGTGTQAVEKLGPPFAGEAFFTGAWCSPSTGTTDPATWRRFSEAGLTLAVRPLEDPNDRARNLATLRLLDTLEVAPSACNPELLSPRLLVRDDAVHPDEATRPAWRERVKAVVAAYRGHRSLAGYFLADEPKPERFDRIAEVAAAFAEADTAHPVYVNLLPLPADAGLETQGRWRADAMRLIQRGHLRLFSFGAYSQGRQGEDAAYLLTLANAANVSRATGCPFAAVLQFTGFGPLDPVPAATLDYLAAEAVAHGASGVIWFTYWTPNPREEGMFWRGGATEYDGTPSARADTLREVNAHTRAIVAALRSRPYAVVHLGGAWPRGSTLINLPISGLAGARGGPITLAAASLPDAPGQRSWLVINRDRSRPRKIILQLEPSVLATSLLRPTCAATLTPFAPLNSIRELVTLDLLPGESVVVRLTKR